MLLINPPISKSCEPPAGIACLAGFLKSQNQPYTVWDASIEAVAFGFKQAKNPKSTWEKRALKNHKRNLALIQSKTSYRNQGKYKKAVNELSKLLQMGTNNTAELANFKHPELFPVNSAHLKQAAKNFRQNPFYPLFASKLPELIKKDNSKHIGISLNYLSQALCTFALAGYIRKNFPDIKISLGGGLVNSWTSNVEFKNPFAKIFDFTVSGKGENKLGQILNLPNTAQPPTHILPDFSQFDFTKYLSPTPILPYAASRGCFWNRCQFCPERAEGSVWEKTPASVVLEDIKKLKQKTPFGLVHFLDNALCPDLLQLLSTTKSIGNWYGFTRFLPQLENENFCKKLAASGCVMLKLGLESGSQKVLDEMQKGVDLKKASVILNNLKKAGIATYVYLLFGTPTETPEQARKTLDFTAKHSTCINFLNLAVFNLPLHSPLSKNLTKNSFYEGDLALYTNFTHPSGWNRRPIREFLEKEFKKHPAIAPIIQNDPTVFTSNHASFFTPGFNW